MVSLENIPGMVTLEVDSAEKTNENAEETERTSAKIRSFIMRQFLPIGILFSIPVGIFFPQPAVCLKQRIPVVKICVIVVYFSIGLRLRFQEAKSAMKCYKEVLVGLIWILFVGPVSGNGVLNTIKQFGPLIGNFGDLVLRNASNSTEKTYANITVVEMPVLGPEEFRLALQIFCMCRPGMATSLIMVSQLD